MSQLVINSTYSLSPDIQLSEIVNVPNILQSVTQTFGGVVIQSRVKAAGQIYELTADLRSGRLYGYFTRADAAYLAGLRDNRTVFPVAHPSRTLSGVIIPADGINLSVWEMDETVEQESADLMHGSIKLIKVI